MGYHKSVEIKITVKFSFNATLIAIIYNILLLFSAILIATIFQTYFTISKPNPGLHILISLPSIPTNLSDIHINSIISFHLLASILIFIVNILITSFFEPLFLSIFIRDSFEELSLLESLVELCKKRFSRYLTYNILRALIVLGDALVGFINPRLAFLIIIILVIIFFTWVYTPVIILLEELSVLEAIKKSYNMVKDNLVEFFKILIISSILITLVTTIISWFPLPIAIMIGFVFWLPVGTLLISLIINAYIFITS